MSEIMSHARWMKYTYGGVTSIRSSQLKAIDSALSRYHGAPTQESLNKLRTAIVGWMQKEGPDWKSSARNRFNAVDDLHKQSMGIPVPSRTADEIVGFSYVRAESRVIVDELFRGALMDWKPGILAKLADNKFGLSFNAAGAAKNAAALKPSSAGVSAKAAEMAEKVFKTLVPFSVAGEVGLALVKVMPDFMKELAASMVPFAGVVTSGGMAVYNGCETIRREYRIHDTQMHQARSLSADEPAAAIQALIRMLERERNYYAYSASVSTAAFVGQLSGVLVDGGTATTAAVGLASNVAKLANIIRVIVEDVKEKSAANQKMRSQQVTGEIFDICPLVGAYLILCVPTSVMLNTVFDRISEHGWRGDVERTVQKHLNPLRDQARRVVQEHRFIIPALTNYPGMFVRNDAKLKEMEDRKGKTGMEGRGAKAEGS
jgi:hypothetical protein